MDEIYLQRDGARLYAAVRGTGPAIVFLHGGLANHESALRFVGELAARFTLVAPDLRGSGRSIFAGELSWAQLADDVAAIARALRIDRAVIAGASFGAGVAVASALAHPTLLRGLAIFMPAFGGGERPLEPAQAAAMQTMEDFGRRALDQGIDALLPIFDALPPPLRDRARATAAAYDPASVAASTRFMNSGAQPFARLADLASITAPTLLVPGADPTHPPELATAYAAHLARCTVRDAGPAQYADVLAGWIDDAL